jgi:hypothetical protein
MRRSRFDEEQVIGILRSPLVDRRDGYAIARPHSAIGNVPPAGYAKHSDATGQGT